MPPVPPSHFTDPFLETLQSASHINAQDDPNYYANDPKSLISQSNVHTFVNGTGSSVYNSLVPLLESTNHELILVTCFWARSDTLQTLNNALLKLSDKAIRRGTEKIRVQLCFSSSSLFQKLFHKQSTSGQEYPPSDWVNKLGLPPKSELGGLDLTVKSIFILPFSVMHPKYIILDRQTVVLPSCNISWEEWFEGAVVLSGPIVSQFTTFHTEFWQRQSPPALPAASPSEAPISHPEPGTSNLPHAHTITHFPSASLSGVPTIFLPSPHRRNPHFQPFTPSSNVKPPSTPLNIFLLTILAKATSNVTIQTPNLTSPPVLSALLSALSRGIDVHIRTSARLMILEQLVTAGTTTSRCIKTLIKRYKNFLRQHPPPSSTSTDEEAAIAISPYRPGRLRIEFFEPLGGPRKKGQEGGEPQQSHLKMMCVDGEVVVLGSGNLDRASWFTSQELGVAFFDKEFVGNVLGSVEEGMRGRTRVVFDSAENV
ncbi:hypothetical protein DM02DRAFT_613777 [Periconia macrospinosa]|uniref:PLD phosphodiesterase domain-containing protein n=1 Tax=Periconia macrospinosa TaxID=97972 RepID=A0A2V1DVE8_9PLEO|nr:hypothetical protein DM02DRAFT_613777 [Periconia macrospinosa]